MKYNIGDKLFELTIDDKKQNWCIYEIVDIEEDIYCLNLVVTNGSNYTQECYFYERELASFKIFKLDPDCPMESQVCAHII